MQRQSQALSSGQSSGQGQITGLEGMLGRPAPDSDTDEASSEVSAQDRQRFMQSLQSPEKGGSRTKQFTQGFGRMRAKAKDMLQARSAANSSSAGSSSGVAASSTSAEEASKPSTAAPNDAEMSRGGKMARDMTMMFAGLRKQSKQ